MSTHFTRRCDVCERELDERTIGNTLHTLDGLADICSRCLPPETATSFVLFIRRRLEQPANVVDVSKRIGERKR